MICLVISKKKEKTGFKKPKCEKMAILHEEPGQEKKEKEGIQHYAPRT